MEPPEFLVADRPRAGASRRLPAAGPLGAPPRVARHRVTRLLDEAVEQPVVLVTAPAGAGKTTALRDWAAATSRQVVWLDGLRPRREPLTAAVAAARLARPLDPLAVVVDSGEVLSPGQLRELLDLAGPDVPVDAQGPVTIVLASRTEPPLPVRQLRLQGSLAQVHGRQLALTPEEAAAQLAAAGVGLPRPLVAQVVQQLGGWMGGLALVAPALARSPEPDSLASGMLDLDDPDLCGFVLTEYVDALPESTRRILLATCEEEVVSSAAAVALSGDPGAGTTLAGLAADGLFITGQEGPERGYRYAPVLAHALRRRLAELPSALHGTVHRRAVVYRTARGDHLGAAERAAAGGDATTAAALLASYGPELVLRGHARRVSALAARLPRRDPRPAAVSAFAAVVMGAPGDAARVLAATGGMPPGLAADTCFLRLWFARCGWQSAEEVLEDAHELMAEDDLDQERGVTRSALLLLGVGATEIVMGRMVEATRHLEAARAVARAADIPALTTLCSSHMAIAYLLRSLPLPAAEAASAALASAGPDALTTGDLARAHLVLCWTHFQAGEIAASATELRAAEAAMPPVPELLLPALLGLLRAWVRGEQGQLDKARGDLETLLAPGPAVPLPLEVMMRCTAAVHALTAGDLDTARRETTVLAAMDVGEADLTGGLLAAAVEGVETGRRRLAPLLDGGRLPVFQITTVAAWIMESLWSQTSDPQRSATAMARAISLAAPHRFRHVFAHAGPQALEQLDAASARVPLPRDPSLPPAEAAERLERLAPDPLSDRETEVLQLLPVAMSYAEIADALYISHNTVKTHVRSVYRKLGARRRSDAVRIARELRLL